VEAGELAGDTNMADKDVIAVKYLVSGDFISLQDVQRPDD